MNDILAMFDFNGKRYVIKFIEENAICFFRRESDGLNSCLTSKEFSLVNKVYESLKINTKDVVLCRKDKKVNGNLYDVYCDKLTNNCFWIPKNGSYNTSDNIFLNFSYNHMPLYVFSDSFSNGKEKSKFYNRFIKIGKKLVPVLIAAEIMLTAFSGCKVVEANKPIEEKEPNISETVSPEVETQETEIIESESIKNEYSFDDIKKVIEENPFLADNEKELIYSLRFVFDEYHEYMNLDLIKERLSSLKVKYTVDGKVDYLSEAAACYSQQDNALCFYRDANFDEVQTGTFIHEFLHVLQNSMTYRYFLCELSNEFFTREILLHLYNEGIISKEKFLSSFWKNEYETGNLNLTNETEWLYYIGMSDGFGHGYKGFVSVYYPLAEILPKEVLANFQFNPDNINIIREYLMQIEGYYTQEALDRVELLLNDIDDLRQLNPETNSYKYSYDAGSIFEEIDYYYKIAKGRSINESLSLSLKFYDETSFERNLDLSNIQSFMIDKYGVYVNDYCRSMGIVFINKPVLDSDGYTTVICFTDSGYKTIVVDEELDLEYSDYVGSTIKR